MPEFSFLERFPMYLYPRGSVAYTARLNQCIDTYGIRGAQYNCYDLILWHAFLHIVGAIIFVLFIFLFDMVSRNGALVASALFVIFFLWQELIDQPRRLTQTYFKGVIDVFTWVLPLALYWTFMAGHS